MGWGAGGFEKTLYFCWGGGTVFFFFFFFLSIQLCVCVSLLSTSEGGGGFLQGFYHKCVPAVQGV